MISDFTWAVRFPRDRVQEARRLWRVADVQVRDDGGDTVWLAGCERNEQVDAILRGFLSGKRFNVLVDGQIQSPQALVPNGYLPKSNWTPFRHWLTVELPQAAFAGQLTDCIPLRLVRTTSTQDPNLLLTDAAAWTRFGTQAAQVRLQRLRFALDRTGKVLIHGRPLPPIPGERLVDYGGIAVSAGWFWDPPFDVEVLAERFQLERGDLAIARSDGTWLRVERDQFVGATRQAIRQSIVKDQEDD